MSPHGASARAPGARALSALAAALTAALATTASACSGGSDVPPTLVDGSPATVSDVRFESVDGPVLRTEERRTSLAIARAMPRTAACLGSGWNSRPAPPVVHRVGVSGESVTFAGDSGRTVQACDGSGSPRTSPTWCGHAFGRLVGGRLRDPRLDLGGCHTSDGDPVAFAWIDPGPGARYVIVERRGYSEAYATGAGLPVRVAVTEGIEPARTLATFGVTEHTASGRLLRRRELEAVVSG